MTEQLKAPAWGSSGTAPVSGRGGVAHPTQADQEPTFCSYKQGLFEGGLVFGLAVASVVENLSAVGSFFDRPQTNGMTLSSI